MAVLDRVPRSGVTPKRGRVEWANTLRGVAAVSVVLFHLCVVFWTVQEIGAELARRPALYVGNAEAPGFARLADALPMDLGAFGVGLFFVISGYVIAFSLDRYSRRGFLIARCFRILPTYAAGFLVTCAVIGIVGDPKDELGFVPVLTGLVPGLPYVLGIRAPSDGVVWTLTIEILFYCVCLLGYRRLARQRSGVLAVAAVCALAQILIAAPATVEGSSPAGLRYLVLLAAPFMPVMLVGLTLSGVQRGCFRWRDAGWMVPALTLVHIWLLSTSDAVDTTVEYRATFAGTILLVVVVALWGGRRRPSAPLGWLADLSYPLYVVHPVLGYALLSWLTLTGLPPALSLALTFAVVASAAWTLHVAVERPTHQLGRRLAGDVERRSTPQPSPSHGDSSTDRQSASR